MKISVNINPNNEETEIIINCKDVDDSIRRILDFLNSQETEFIVGKSGQMQHILKPTDIHYVHTEADSVVAVTESGSFILKEKLYELEQILPSNQFVRLSKSVIANLYELSRFEASFNGTLCVYFKSGKKEYVSRTYVHSIKEALQMNRRKSE